MKSSREKLRSIIPFVKEYAKTRGVHADQQFPVTNRIYNENAVSAIIRNNTLDRNIAGMSYCFAHLFQRAAKDETILLQIQPPKDDQNVEAYTNYIKWVVNDSPWADAFVNKNISTILKRGVVVLNVEQPRWLVKEAAIALRMAWENYGGNGKYKSIDVWWELAQKNDPHLAFIVGFLMTKPKDKTIIPIQWQTGHSPINYYNDPDMFPGKNNNHLLGWLKRKTNSNGGWTAQGRVDITEDIRAAIQSIKADKKKSNPFDYTSSSKSFDREEFINAMNEFLPKLQEKYLNV